jgi:hypothetical protein
MLIGLGIAVLALVVAWFGSGKLGFDVRNKISVSALSSGAVVGTTAGFMYNSTVGMVVLSAMLIIIAVLFGYERA